MDNALKINCFACGSDVPTADFFEVTGFRAGIAYKVHVPLACGYCDTCKVIIPVTPNQRKVAAAEAAKVAAAALAESAAREEARTAMDKAKREAFDAYSKEISTLIV